MTGTKILLSASLSLQKHAQQYFVTIDQKYYNNSFQHSLHRHIHLPISGISVCYEGWGVGVRLPGASFYPCHQFWRASFYTHLHSPSTHIPGPQNSRSPSPSLPFCDSSFYTGMTHKPQLLPDATASRHILCKGFQFTTRSLPARWR